MYIICISEHAYNGMTTLVSVYYCSLTFLKLYLCENVHML